MILCRNLDLLGKNQKRSLCIDSRMCRSCIRGGIDGIGRAWSSSWRNRLDSGLCSRISRNRLGIARIGCWIGSIPGGTRYRFFHLCSFGSLICMACIFRFRGSSCPYTVNIHPYCNQHKTPHTEYSYHHH